LFASAGNDREIKTWNIKGKNKKIFSEKHNDVIRRLLLLKDGRIASICIDGELKIWSIKGTCERTIKANADCALIQLENEKLCISCLDFSLKIINLKGKEKKLFKGHENTVIQIIELGNNKLVSSSFDKTIKIWDKKKGKLLKNLTGHTETVREIIRLKDDRIVSTSFDKSIRIWDESGLLQKFDIINPHYEAITISNNRYITAGENGDIKIWKSKIFEKEKKRNRQYYNRKK